MEVRVLMYKLYIVLHILFVGTSLCLQSTGMHEHLQELDRFIKHTLNCRNLPAIAISLVKDDTVIFSRGYGHADMAKETKATEHTKFCIGSLTKAFTSTVIADILSKHTKITWDTPVREILGDTFELSDDLRTNNVNLRDLLAHKVGTPSNFHALVVGFPSNTSREDLVRRLRYMPAVGSFRTDFYYSNYMYMLAGYIAEAISGESWESMVKTRLLDRLGMHDTGFVDKLDSLDDITVPYVLLHGQLVPVDKELLLTVSPSGPAGSIYSTASDMAKWMLLHLRNGKVPGSSGSGGHKKVTDDKPHIYNDRFHTGADDDRLHAGADDHHLHTGADEASGEPSQTNTGGHKHDHHGHHHNHQLIGQHWLEETYTSQMTHPFPEKDLTRPKHPISDVSVSYNMGWMTSIYRGYRKLWHSGGIVTFTSQLWLFPDVHAGVFITASGPLSSEGSLAIKAIAARASDLLLGENPWLNVSTACTYPAPWDVPPTEMNQSAQSKPGSYIWNISRPLQDYVGVYGHLGFGNITILIENNTFLDLLFGRFGKMRLQSVNETTFYGYYIEKLWFITDSDNNRKPVNMNFVIEDNLGVTGLLFPIDFEQDKTLFERGLKFLPGEDGGTVLYTSYACSSGSTRGVMWRLSALASHTLILFTVGVY